MFRGILDWVKSNKDVVYALTLVLVGMVGGNVDRVSEVLKKVFWPTPVVQTVSDSE